MCITQGALKCFIATRIIQRKRNVVVAAAQCILLLTPIAQADAAAGYPEINKFNEGDHVRWRRTKTRFTKANEPQFHPGIFRIISVKPSVPTPSYVIQNVQSGITVPGSLDYTQLEHADDYQPST